MAIDRHRMVSSVAKPYLAAGAVAASVMLALWVFWPKPASRMVAPREIPVKPPPSAIARRAAAFPREAPTALHEAAGVGTGVQREAAKPPVGIAALPAKPRSISPPANVFRGRPPVESDEVEGEEAETSAPTVGPSLESLIRHKLSQSGFPRIGISVSRDGDVFLEGTFYGQAEEDHLIELVRGCDGVRDIYFSGTVWQAPTDLSEPSKGTPPRLSRRAISSPPPSKQPGSSANHASSDALQLPITAADIPPATSSSSLGLQSPSAKAQWPSSGSVRWGSDVPDEWDAKSP